MRLIRRAFSITLYLFLAGTASIHVGCSARDAAATVTLDPTITYQTFAGWESVVLSSVHDYKRVLSSYEALLDEAVNDLGITRIQIAVPSGIEQKGAASQQYLDGTMSEAAYFGSHAYTVVNDNADPMVADLSGFDFTLLDWQVEHVVLPFVRHVTAFGRTPYTYISYSDTGKAGFKHYQDPAEYAEFMLVLFDHLKTKYQLVPDGINVVNEPDNITGWTPRLMGAAVAAAGPRLDAAGYHPDFIVPSTMDRGLAVPYFNEVVAVPGASPYIKELSYHCYADSAWDSFARIGAAAIRFGVRTTMNECWDARNNYAQLHQDLKRARVSAWQQGALNGPHGYYRIESSRPVLNAKTRIMRQYFHYIAPGARRIEASAFGRGCDPLAFVNPHGAYVVILRADARGVCTIANLPAGSYGISYATDREFDVRQPTITVSAGQPVAGTIPAAGVITVYSVPKAVASPDAGVHEILANENLNRRIHERGRPLFEE